MRKIYMLLITVLFLACSSVERLYEKGNHEQLIKKVIQKEQKGKAKQSEIRYLEEAYEREQDNVLYSIGRAYESSQPSKWIEIHSLARRLEILQQNISHYLPLRANNGYTAHFEFVDLSETIEEASYGSFQYLMDDARELIQRSERNLYDKQSARRAFAQLEQARRYDQTEELELLSLKAKELGTIKVATSIRRRDRVNRNISFTRRGNRIDRELENLVDFGGGEWVEFLYGAGRRESADYIMEVALVDVDLSRISEERTNQNYSEQERERVVDQSGNPVLDSIGNPIFTFRTVTARVETTTFQRDSEVDVEARLIQTGTNAVVFRRRYDESQLYTIETCEVFGEDRIVPNSDLCRNELVDFPSDDEMVSYLLSEMRRDVQRDLARAIEQSP